MLSYLLHLTLCWGLFALLYHALLRRQSLFGVNRCFLLLTALAGLVLPVLNRAFPALNAASADLALNLPVVTVGLEQAAQQTTHWVGISYLLWIYFAGVLLTALRMFWGLGRIGVMLAAAPREYLADGSVLVRTEKARLPFSFFTWIFVPIDFGARASDRDMLAHEHAHVRAWHSVDVLLLEILCVAFWFHPLAHWYRHSLRTVHEYQADAAAAAQTSRKHYGLLLLQQAQTRLPIAFANHFFQSPLKKRLLMLTKNHASAYRQIWKYALALPLFVALWACSGNDKIELEHASQSKPPVELFQVDKAPEFPGGEKALLEYLSGAIQYPEIARRANAEAIVAIRFVVETDGQITQVEALTPSKTATADEGQAESRRAMEAESIRVVKDMPRWSPAYKSGAPVASKLTLPIKFKLK